MSLGGDKKIRRKPVRRKIMKKIWQKSLACMVSAALCLTAFVGCLTVNAAEFEGTVTSEGVSVTTEDNQATVTLTLSSPTKAMNVAAVKVSTGYGTLASVELVENKTDNYKIEAEGVDLASGKLFVEAIGNETGFTTADVVLTFNKAASVVEGTYPVEVLAFAGDTAASWDEKTINLAVTGEINITVNAATTEPVIDTNIALGRSILARDKMGIRFITIKSQLSTYADYYLEVKSQHFTTKTSSNPYELTDSTNLFKYVADGNEVPAGYTPQAAENSTYHYYDYTGITAYEMTLPMNVTIYCLDTNGQVVAKSQTWTFSLASRIKDSQLTNSASDTVYVDLVNYGTAVQTYFAEQYPDSDLGKYGVLPNAGFDDYQKYATTGIDSSNAVNVNNGKPTENANGAAVGKGMQVQATNQLFFMILAGTNNVDDLTLKVNYVNSYGIDKSAVANVKDMTYSSGRYYYYFDDDKNVALYDTAVTITAELYSGNTKLYTRTYSVGSFVSETMATSTGTLKNVGDTLMRFTSSVRAALSLDS